MPASDLYFVQEPVGEMANLAYLIGSRATREALLVDPAWDVDALLARAERDGMRVVGSLATHYHQDHVGGSDLRDVDRGTAAAAGGLPPCRSTSTRARPRACAA